MGATDSMRCRYGAPTVRPTPFLLLHDDDGARLIAPFAKRQRGLSPEEAAQVKTVAGLLRGLPQPGAPPVWINPEDGTATAASIGAGQLRRRLADNAIVRLRTR